MALDNKKMGKRCSSFKIGAGFMRKTLPRIMPKLSSRFDNFTVGVYKEQLKKNPTSLSILSGNPDRKHQHFYLTIIGNFTQFNPCMQALVL